MDFVRKKKIRKTTVAYIENKKNKEGSGSHVTHLNSG